MTPMLMGLDEKVWTITVTIATDFVWGVLIITVGALIAIKIWHYWSENK